MTQPPNTEVRAYHSFTKVLYALYVKVNNNMIGKNLILNSPEYLRPVYLVREKKR